jgi:hypothetical protein
MSSVTDALPIELRRELQVAIAEIVKRSLEEKGLQEEDILEDFEKSRGLAEKSFLNIARALPDTHGVAGEEMGRLAPALPE